MKVVLTRDVKGTGRAHDTVEVSDGFALNNLIPKGWAISATDGAQKAAESRKSKREQDRQVKMQLLAQNLATLAEARIVITTKANEQGHLYDAVGASELSAAVKEQTHVDLPEEAIKLERPLKELGEHEVPVAAGEHFGKFTVVIEAEV